MRSRQTKGKEKHECVVELLQQRDTLGVMMIPFHSLVLWSCGKDGDPNRWKHLPPKLEKVRAWGMEAVWEELLQVCFCCIPHFHSCFHLLLSKLQSFFVGNSTLAPTHEERALGTVHGESLTRPFPASVNKQVVFFSQWSKLACITKSSLSLRPS